MKNKDSLYLQYNKLAWKNQEKTKINLPINNYIIKHIFLNKQGCDISIFDIGFGIGFFIKNTLLKLKRKYQNIVIEGCEPAKRSYNYFSKKKPKRIRKGIILNFYNKKFLEVHTDKKFDFITAIYAFPHFILKNLEISVKKIYSMLNNKGEFILVLADEKYLKNKLKSDRNLLIEKDYINFKGRKYEQILHFADIPKIGRVMDYDREEKFYIDLFTKNRFLLKYKNNINDNGFISTIFVFKKNKR